MTATPRTSCSPGISRSTTRATRRVKAGLKVSKGVTSEASALESACEESRLAAQLSRAEPRSAATNTASMCGQCAEQEREAVSLNRAFCEEERTHRQQWKGGRIDSPCYERWPR